jgi:hypothetical protein
MRWFRLSTNTKWFPHPFQTYAKVFAMIQMMWLSTWIHHHSTTLTFAGVDFGKSTGILGIFRTESMPP